MKQNTTNTPDIEKAVSWFMDLPVEKRIELSDQYFPKSHDIDLEDEEIEVIWRKETNQPQASSNTAADSTEGYTPLPLAIGKTYMSRYKEYLPINTAKIVDTDCVYCVAVVYPLINKLSEEDKANAQRIVYAWNNIDRLEEEAKRLREALKNLWKISSLASEAHVFQKELDAATEALNHK